MSELPGPANGIGHARPPGVLDDSADADGVTLTDRPDPEFEIESAAPRESAATPTLSFSARVSDASGIEVYTMALSVLFTIEPGKRSYDETDRERLVELFGEPERWASTTGSFRWSQVDVLVPSFTGEGRFSIELPCTYDHEVAATKYFHGLSDGEVPLQLHFNGTVFYKGPDGRLQLMPLPWDRSIRWTMPLQTWRQMISHHYPQGTWVRVEETTLDRLTRAKSAGGWPTYEACIAGMLDRSENSVSAAPPGGEGDA